MLDLLSDPRMAPMVDAQGNSWILDSPDYRAALELQHNNQEGGNSYYEQMSWLTGSQDPSAWTYDPNSRDGYYLTNGGNTKVYAKFDAQGNMIPGTQRTLGTNDSAAFYAALAGLGVAGGAALAGGVGSTAGSTGAAAGSGGYSVGTLSAAELPAAGGYTTAAGLNAGALNGMQVAGAGGAMGGAAGGLAGSATGGGGMSEAAYGWNPEGYTGGTPSLAGGGGVGGGSSMFGNMGTSDWLNLGGSLLNGYLGSRAAGKASEQQMAAMREANALQKYMYDQTRQDNMPALQARNNGLSGYQNLLKDPSGIVNDPGYKFGFDQGNKAIGSQAAANGSYYSGATLKALDKFGQDYAGSKFDQSLNRYGHLAGLGDNGANAITGAGLNYGNQVGQNLIGGGNARGAATIGQYNAWQNAINQYQGYNNYQDWMKRQPGG